MFEPWIWKIPWRRKWQPTPVLGQRSLARYSPQGRKESDTAVQLRTHTPITFYFEANLCDFPLSPATKGNLCYLNSQTRQLGLSNGVKFTWLLSCRAKLLTQICVNLPEINYTFHQLQGNSLCKPLRKNGKCCQLHLCTMLSYHLSFNCRILEKKFILKSFFNL